MLSYGCGNNRNPETYKVDLLGVGVTFPQTFYDIIISNYEYETGNKVSYNKTNTSGGIRAFRDKVVDFVVTDMLLTEEEMADCQSEILHIPSALGAVVLAYNVPGIQELNLNPELIAGIYLGRIKYWDDSLLVAVNPESKLTHLRINPVFRADESGTTYLLSRYLSESCLEWKRDIGVRKSIKLQTGIAVKGNSAMVHSIKDLEGSIGYIGMEHASLLNLPIAAIQNSSGNYIKANKQTLYYYVTEIEFPDDMRILFTDPKKENTYPIPCLSWILAYKNQAYNHRSVEKYKSLKSFLIYVINPETQKITSRLTYLPLPATVVAKAQKLIDSMVWEDELKNGE